ncbi:hypothetical protein ACH4TX_41915 [Streptomyces sp. NPDC021098]|uniref:hypothetical protein n=1 Tax=unclassified Streptomyces TaxID=2593676 RepID=UPI0037B00CE0
MTDIDDTTTDAPIDSPTDPEPTDPTPQPSTEPPLRPTEPFSFQPYLWYSGTWACATNTCRNYNQVKEEPLIWSNNGTNVVIYCGVCNKRSTILSATLLSPQPPEE